MLAYVFPGQGSQSIGMGEGLFQQFADLTQQADHILGYSIEELCLQDPKQQLNQTEYTQPALFTVNALSYLKKVEENPNKPNFLAGHSLGEYNALFAAEVFDFATGLKLVKKRGELMSQAQGGAMAAVIGLMSSQIEDLLAEQKLTGVKAANYNSYQQTVITGVANQIERAIPLLESAGATMVVPLKVSGAFHSPLMAEAEQEFTAFLKTFDFKSPKIPVIANLNAEPYQANLIHDTLAQQITHSVQWVKTIEYLLSQGVSQFEEVGPGRVLAGLIGRIMKKK